jgi:hypothetical protein
VTLVLGQQRDLVAVQGEDLPRPGDFVDDSLARGLTGTPKFQILGTVVISDPIAMMDLFITAHRPTEDVSHDGSVFGLASDHAVATTGDISRSVRGLKQSNGTRIACLHEPLTVEITEPIALGGSVAPIRVSASIRPDVMLTTKAPSDGLSAAPFDRAESASGISRLDEPGRSGVTLRLPPLVMQGAQIAADGPSPAPFDRAEGGFPLGEFDRAIGLPPGVVHGAPPSGEHLALAPVNGADPVAVLVSDRHVGSRVAVLAPAGVVGTAPSSGEGRPSASFNAALRIHTEILPYGCDHYLTEVA